MRLLFAWFRMIFDFIKRLFGLVDESPRKRRADESDNDYTSNFVSPKKRCCGLDDSRYGKVVYANENDEEQIQFLGESHYSPVRSKQRLNGTSSNKRKLSGMFQRSSAPECRRNSASMMNGKEPKPSRFSTMSMNAMSVADCKHSTLAKTNQLRDKHAYGQLLQQFVPSRVQVMRNKPQEEDSKRRVVAELIDLEKFETPSTSVVKRASWKSTSNDVFFTPLASTPLKFYTPRESKSKIEEVSIIPARRCPNARSKDDDVSTTTVRRRLSAKTKDGDSSIGAARRTSNEKSGTTPRIIPIIRIDSVEDVTPVESPKRPESSTKTEQPSTSRVANHNEAIATNTLRDNLAAKAVMKRDFIPRVCGNYNERVEQSMKEVEELKRITCLLAENNRLTREAALETRLARSMRLSEAVLDETEQLDEDALPTLTPAMLQEIKNALVPNPPNECLVESFGLRITRKDIHTLYGLNWLNDEVINFYMNLLIARGNGSNDKYPRVHAMNTFFYPKLLSGGHASLKRWTRKIDIFAQDILVVPIHLGIHWCMSIIDFRDKTIRYFDSMGGSNPKCLAALKKYLEDESLDKKKKPFDTNDWKSNSMKDIPQQMNGSDCGVFSCMFAEFLSADKKITFTQQDMPYFRNKMVYEILKAKLL